MASGTASITFGSMTTAATGAVVTQPRHHAFAFTTHAPADITLKVGDLEPSLLVTLTDDTGAAVDVSEALSIMFRMGTAGSRVELFSRACIVDDAEAGDVAYLWQDGDTDDMGTYYAEIVVEWPSGRLQTFPTSGYMVVTIEPAIT